MSSSMNVCVCWCCDYKYDHSTWQSKFTWRPSLLRLFRVSVSYLDAILGRHSLNQAVVNALTSYIGVMIRNNGEKPS